jgi:hypothetical protein
MPNILTEAMVALVSGSVSAIDGQPYGHQGGQVSAHLGTLYEFMQKLLNRIDTPSATLISGNSAGAIMLAAPTSVGVSAAVVGRLQGWPFAVMSANQVSGQPNSAVSTTATQIRKVLVGLTFSALPLASSFSSNAGATMVFVVGSAYATASGAASDGAASQFAQVPLPKPSAGLVPLGWLNIPNGCPGSTGISATCMITDYRTTQGVDLSLTQGTVYQP